MMGQVDIHINLAHRMLHFIAFIQDRDGILDILYPNLIDPHPAVIPSVLNVNHFPVLR
jgi:hypothetical protein